jgi:multiple sugar transport system substrate-binding protein
MEREAGVAMKRMVLLLLLAASCTKPPSHTVEITYQTVETLPEQQAIHRVIVGEFERTHTNIHVNVLYDTSKFQKLNVQLAGGVAPDVFYYIVDRLPALARRGVLVDMSEIFAPHAEEFFPEVVEPCRIDGKLVMMPYHFSTDILFYNRDWLALDSVPNDWTAFAESASHLAKQRQIAFATVLPRPLLLLQSFGASVFSNNTCTVNSLEAVAALEFYRSLVASNIAPTVTTMAEMEAFDGVNLFQNQRIAMLVGRTYMLTEFDKIANFRWDVAPVPQGKLRWSRLSVGGNCIWRGTKHPREAEEFVEFYSTEGAKLAASSRNAIPAFRSAAAAAKFPPVMLEALQYSRLDNPWGYAFWDEFNQRSFVETAEAVALGRLSATDALQSMESFGNELLRLR